MHNDQIIKDIAQNVFLNVWKKWAEIAATVKIFDAYLFRMTRNKTLNYLSCTSMVYDELQETLPSASSDDTLATVEGRDLRRRVAEAVQMLPPQQRRVFELSRLCHLSYLEIARVGESVGSICVRSGDDSYTLTCPEAQDIGTEQAFRIVLPAGTYRPFVIENSEGKYCVRTAKSAGVTIGANQIQPMRLSGLSFGASSSSMTPMNSSPPWKGPRPTTGFCSPTAPIPPKRPSPSKRISRWKAGTDLNLPSATFRIRPPSRPYWTETAPAGC